MSNVTAYNKTVSQAAANIEDDEERRLGELRALVQMGLKYPLDERTFQALVQIQAVLRTIHHELVLQYEARRIGPEEYLSRMNAALESSATSGRALLGRNQYESIFGDGAPTEELVDPEIFLAQHRPDPSSLP
jgi:hypothetical protein